MCKQRLLYNKTDLVDFALLQTWEWPINSLCSMLNNICDLKETA